MKDSVVCGFIMHQGIVLLAVNHSFDKCIRGSGISLSSTPTVLSDE
jgi:hypothetical protein